MEATAEDFYMAESARPRLTTIKTTLYELIEAIDEEVEPGEEWLVVKTVSHLLNTGSVTFFNDFSNGNEINFATYA